MQNQSKSKVVIIAPKKVVEDKRVRRGKTAKDRASGAFSRNRANKQARADWRNSTFMGSAGGSPDTFPAHTCGSNHRRGK